MSHPLDPLSAAEIGNVVSILRRDRHVETPRWRFAIIELAEPSKSALASTEQPAREALVTCWNRDDGHTYKARVSLSDDSVTDWKHRPGEQANFTEDELRVQRGARA